MSRTCREKGQMHCGLGASIKLSLLILALVGSGMTWSDSGVRADEAAAPITVDGPGPGITQLPPARVIRVDARGWLEIVRPNDEQFNVVTVITGFGCEPGDPLCQALAEGGFGETVDRFRQMAAAGIDDAWVLAGLGNAQLMQGDLGGAMRTFVWAVADHPRDEDVRLGLAAVLSSMGATGQAADEYRQLLESPQVGAVALIHLANIHRQEGRLKDAESAYRLALDRDPKLLAPRYNRGISLMELGDHAAAAEVFRSVSRQAPALADAYLYEGLALLRSNQSVRATVALYRARDLDPDNPALDLALGLASQEVGLDQEAIARLKGALAVHGEDERIHHLLAVSLVRTGRLAEAADVLEGAFALGAKDADAHFQLGLKLFLCEQADRAIDHFIQAMAKGKRDADTFFAIGQAFLQDDQADAALKALFIASRLSPEAAQIRYSLGLALDQTGDGAGALRELEAAARLDPADVDIQHLLMKTQLRAGDFKACARVGRKVIDEHPEIVSTRFDIAFCHALSGELDRAAESIEDALDHDLDGDEVLPLWRRVDYLVESGAGLPGAYLLLGMIHERRGNWSQAIEAYEGLILSKKGGSWAPKALTRIHLLSPAQPPLAAP